MKLYIKNMVCPRCIAAVEAASAQAGLQPSIVRLGEIELQTSPAEDQLQTLDSLLAKQGFERIDDRQSRIIEGIKTAIVELVHHTEEQPKENVSHYLASKLHHDYTYLSNLFSRVESTTIEHYYIAQKIERVKELLTYDELSLSEIAWKLGYSSTAHLSSQFKKVTGMTPTQFKGLKEHSRTGLDKL